MTDRLQEFHNEAIEIVAFECRKRGFMFPTHAVFLDDVPGGKVVIPVFAEDLKAMEKAGYSVKQSAGDLETPIPAIIDMDGDVLRYIIAADGTEHEIRRRGEGRESAAGRMIASAAPLAIQEPAPVDTPAPEPVNGKARLYAKMARVMGNMQRIPKTGHNAHFNYDFVTEADIADAVRRAMSEAGIAFFCEIVDWRRESSEVTRRDRSGNNYTVTKWTTYLQVRFTFACTDTGATIERLWNSEADDDQDKGINKAITAAQKYFLKTTFIISTGDELDDPDNSVDDAQQDKPAQAKRQPAKSTPKAPSKPAPAPKPDNGDKQAPVFKGKFDEPFNTTDFWKAINAMPWNAPAHKINTLNKMWDDVEIDATMTAEEAIAAVETHMAAKAEASS